MIRRRLFAPDRRQRGNVRSHITRPGVEALEVRRLLSGGADLAQDYGQLPLSFEANRGQTDPQVKFLARGGPHSLFLTPTEAVFVLTTRTQAEKNQLPLHVLLNSIPVLTDG